MPCSRPHDGSEEVHPAAHGRLARAVLSGWRTWMGGASSGEVGQRDAAARGKTPIPRIRRTAQPTIDPGPRAANKIMVTPMHGRIAGSLAGEGLSLDDRPPTDDSRERCCQGGEPGWAARHPAKLASGMPQREEKRQSRESGGQQADDRPGAQGSQQDHGECHGYTSPEACRARASIHSTPAQASTTPDSCPAGSDPHKSTPGASPAAPGAYRPSTRREAVRVKGSGISVDVVILVTHRCRHRQDHRE